MLRCTNTVQGIVDGQQPIGPVAMDHQDLHVPGGRQQLCQLIQHVIGKIRGFFVDHEDIGNVVVVIFIGLTLFQLIQTRHKMKGIIELILLRGCFDVMSLLDQLHVGTRRRRRGGGHRGGKDAREGILHVPGGMAWIGRPGTGTHVNELITSQDLFGQIVLMTKGGL